jgi:hypothetical protein
MTSPTNRPTPTDGELAARLHATFERAEARVAADPATRELAMGALDRGARRRLPAWSGFAVAAVAVVVVVAGVATSRAPITPGPVAASGAAPASVLPTGTPSTSGSPAAHPTPDLTTIYPVGSGAEAQVAASTDGAAFLVSGWLLGSDVRGCASEPYVQPGVVSWDGCNGLWLHPEAGGGATLVVYRALDTTPPNVEAGMALPVVILVHTHDQACLDDSCRQVPVFLYTESMGDAIPIPSATSTAPPNGLDASQAVTAARTGADTQLPGDSVVQSAVAGPFGAIVANGTDVATDRWVWAVTFASSLGRTSTYQVVVDYVTGEFLGLMTPAPQRAPAAGPDSPVVIGGQPVHGGDDARQAIGTSANTPILVGGWLLGTDRRLCPADGSTVPLEAAWNPCAGAWVHPSSEGGLPLALYALTGSGAPTVPDGQALPIVFRVHTHDPSLTGDDKLLPVIEGVAWTGTPLSVASTNIPTGGISAARAERVAMAVTMGKLTTVRVSYATTLAGLKALSGWDLSNTATTPDTWVWVVLRTDGSSPARTAGCAIVDMRTGKFLGGMRPYP